MKNPILGILAILFVSLSSCSKIYDTYDHDCESSQVSYLRIRVSTAGASSASTLRAQGDHPSINTDAADHEDYVRNVAVLVYDTQTGVLVASKETTETAFTLKVRPGTLDFYFIANYDDAAGLSGKSRAADLDAYLAEPRAFKSTDGAKSTYFPMARVYKSQTIGAGGSVYQPLPFQPVDPSSQALSPISTIGSDDHSTTPVNSVHLIRSCAKISFTIRGVGLKDINNIRYVGAVPKYTYGEIDHSEYAKIKPARVIEPKFTERPGNTAITMPITEAYDAISTVFYVPERLFSDTEEKGWIRTATEDKPKGGVQYISILLKDEREYKIPVIFNGDQKKSDESYIQFARSSAADYNIVRNHEYHYDITLNKLLLISFSVAEYNNEILDGIQIFPTE